VHGGSLHLQYNLYVIYFLAFYKLNVIYISKQNNIRVIEMKSGHRSIMREQLDKTFNRLSEIKHLNPPVKGWLRSIREALGLSGKQLGERMDVSQPRIVQMEKDELSGSVTLKTMRQAAEALDCVFVYALVPRTSLEETIREQAKKVAQKRLSRTNHTMLLEDQSVSDDERKKMFDAKVEELIREMPRDFWSEKP
jgi:predicted DNA-binding mobile mystery protein A